MHSTAPHRTNSDFQLRHFVAGSCFTPDAAYVLLYKQAEQWRSLVADHVAERLEVEAEKEDATDAHLRAKTLAERKRADARRARAARALDALDEKQTAQRAELATIEALMAEIKPHCRYADLPIDQQAEASQHDEWREEFQRRAENMQLAALCGIPYDHLQAMRQHPDWQASILPHLMETRQRLAAARTPDALQAALTPTPQFLIGDR